jgi:two-component system, chemotaxis family, chemotaxis protein CheY
MARILTVDDSRTMRQLIVFTLTDAGHEVEEADGFDAACRMAAEGRYDLVISDINMPGKNGIELVKALRTKTETRFTPILMLTTESQSALRDSGKAAGASGWIVKPFQPTQLVAMIDKVLG